jgi:hypothetical protein
MKKNLLLLLCLGSVVMTQAQSLQASVKGQELVLQLEKSLETYYGHDMILTPTYEKGMKEYAHEQANIPLRETPFDGNAHYHKCMHFSPDLFNQIDNATLVNLLTPDDAMNEQAKNVLTLINPNRFYVEQFTLNNELYIVLALDRPFDYKTWKAEE